MPLLIQHALEEENSSCSSMTDVHSDSDCMSLVMENSVSLRDLIQWLTTLFTRRFSSLLNWNLSHWDYFLGFGSYPLATQNKFGFFLIKRISKILFQLFRYCDLAFLNLLPLIFHLMDKQLLFPYPLPVGSDLQTPYHPGHIQLTAIIYWMTHVLCWYDPCAVLCLVAQSCLTLCNYGL